MPRNRAKRTDLHGLIVIDKPLSITSFGVVKKVRHHAGGAKTGHAGTLDPLATGVLICALGRATKSIDRLMGMTKVYQTTINLAGFSATDDAEGPIELLDLETPPDEPAVRAAVEQFVGEIQQTPPAYSAIKVGGRRAYDLARKGKDVTLAPRIVRIDRIELDSYDWPHLTLTVTCGKGVYIRSLARQIGEALQTGGYLTALRRTAIGPYTLKQSWSLDQFPDRLEQEHLLPIPE